MLELLEEKNNPGNTNNKSFVLFCTAENYQDGWPANQATNDEAEKHRLVLQTGLELSGGRMVCVDAGMDV